MGSIDLLRKTVILPNEEQNQVLSIVPVAFLQDQTSGRRGNNPWASGVAPERHASYLPAPKTTNK